MCSSWTWTTWTASWPVAEPAVVDTSPLIFLAGAGLLDLLEVVIGPASIPRTVAAEVRRRGPEDVTARALARAHWLAIVEDPPIPEVILARSLGPGESAVLAWALAHPPTEAILDDQAARRCATALDIRVRGTVGLVLAARRRGLLPAARPVLEQLRRSGMYLSDRVLEQALARVGESSPGV